MSNQASVSNCGWFRLMSPRWGAAQPERLQGRDASLDEAWARPILSTRPTLTTAAARPRRRLRESRISEVLVGIDESASDHEAIEQAHRFALASGARLHLLHALPDARARGRSAGPLRRRELEVYARFLVERLTGRKREGYRLTFANGRAEDALVTAAASEGVELLVIGGDTSGTLFDGILGGVTEEVLARITCPVLIARPSPASACVLAATDLTDPSLPAVQAAAATARRGSYKVHVLHALSEGGAEGRFRLEGRGTWPGRRIEWMLAGALRRFGAPGECTVIQGRPAQLIVGVARKLAAELIVLGGVARRGARARGLLPSGVAERVARAAPCSVLVVQLHRRGRRAGAV